MTAPRPANTIGFFSIVVLKMTTAEITVTQNIGSAQNKFKANFIALRMKPCYIYNQCLL